MFWIFIVQLLTEAPRKQVSGPHTAKKDRASRGTETREYRRMPCRRAVITHGFALPARYVIHAVVPEYGAHQQEKLLASCYDRVLALSDRERILTASEIPCLRARSPAFAPSSCSFRIATICSSLNRFRFIVRPSCGAGL